MELSERTRFLTPSGSTLDRALSRTQQWMVSQAELLIRAAREADDRSSTLVWSVMPVDNSHSAVATPPAPTVSTSTPVSRPPSVQRTDPFPEARELLQWLADRADRLEVAARALEHAKSTPNHDLQDLLDEAERLAGQTAHVRAQAGAAWSLFDGAAPPTSHDKALRFYRRLLHLQRQRLSALQGRVDNGLGSLQSLQAQGIESIPMGLDQPILVTPQSPSWDPVPREGVSARRSWWRVAFIRLRRVLRSVHAWLTHPMVDVTIG